MAVQDLRDSVEEELDLVVAQDRWAAFFQRFFVILKTKLFLGQDWLRIKKTTKIFIDLKTSTK